LTGMATNPVATTASNNPVLSTLAAAVTEAGLAETLNSSEALTVFAPTNDAFAKIPKDTPCESSRRQRDAERDPDLHVVGERHRPADLSAECFPRCRAAPSRP
jgi:uncharacterized surface protein with fasciclin (FAS1) repeats